MDEGADILVNTCASVKRGEHVTIVTDAARLAIAKPLVNAVERAAAIPTIVVEAGRSIDNEEPDSPVASAMMSSQVVFLPVSHALAHTEATKHAIAHGARIISMTAFTERMLREGGLFADFPTRRPFCDELARRLSDAERVRVINPAGTDVEFSVTGRRGNSHSCMLSEPGFTAVPNIEANTSPVEGTTHGILVVDGSIPYYGVGVIREPVRMTIRGGVVREIAGGEQAVFLDALLSKQLDPNVYNIAQFAFGLNPLCTTFTGEMLNDEGVNGTIHIGVGTSSNLGGTVRARTHFDAIIKHPTVFLDDVAVLIDGRFAIDESTAIR